MKKKTYIFMTLMMILTFAVSGCGSNSGAKDNAAEGDVAASGEAEDAEESDSADEAGDAGESDSADEAEDVEDSEGADGAASEALPAYTYDGDAAIAAICDYLTNDIASNYSAAEVSIPYLKTVDTDDTDPDDTKVWGDFWVINYNLNGETLEMVSGGNHPGLFHLQKNDDGSYAVTDFEAVEDGSNYLPSAKRIFGDKYEDFAKVQSDRDAMEEIRAEFIKAYVDANGLNITAYKDYGWDPVALD